MWVLVTLLLLVHSFLSLASSYGGRVVRTPWALLTGQLHFHHILKVPSSKIITLRVRDEFWRNANIQYITNLLQALTIHDSILLHADKFSGAILGKNWPENFIGNYYYFVACCLELSIAWNHPHLWNNKYVTSVCLLYFLLVISDFYHFIKLFLYISLKLAKLP